MSDKLDTIQAVAGIALTGVTLYIAARAILGPDKLQAFNMQLLRSCENLCQHQAEWWAHNADTCKRAYERSRTVTA